ncbi:hypothetical protein [Modicisalibacter muralis]|nr:hypothetical protein [Halomonas muralis]
MNMHSTVSKLIFIGMTTFALSGVALAESEDMQSMEDDAPVSTTDQEGVAGKDSANHEMIEEDMDHDAMAEEDSAMGMEHEGTGMEDDAPISTTDQEGMAGKDSASHEEMDEDM